MNLPGPIRSLLAAIVCFTRWPIPVPLSHEDFSKSSLQLPLLGWILGGLQCGLAVIIQPYFSADLRIFLILLLPIIVTGAMHEDGLADFVDGILGGKTRDDKLAIMKDPRLGSFGTLSLIISVIGNWLALRSIDADKLCVTLLATAVLSRCLAISLLAFLPYAAHKDGLSQAYLPKIKGGWRSLSALWPGLLVFFLWQDLSVTIWCLVILLALHLILTLKLRQSLGGLTGDCLGASIKFAELALLLLLASLWPQTH